MDTNGNMRESLTMCSLFDGSGAFSVAGMLAGIKPVSCSEIEPFCIRVTTKRLPFIKHYGDISTLNGAELEPVDIITFGSPCTDLSVAGKRAGLNAARSGLFFQAVRIIKEMRCATNGKYPKYAVWENVPGAYSSNGGEDFRCVIEELLKIKDESASVPKPKKWEKAGEVVGNGYSLAWRTLDAQYFGVPQRRRRCYLVVDFDGERASKILFESESSSRYSPQSFRTWQRTAEGSSTGSGTASEFCMCDQGGQRIDILTGKTSTLRAEAHHPPLVFENHSQDTRYKGLLDVAQTISATYGMGGNNQPFVVESAGFCTEHSAKAHGIGYEQEMSPTLRAGVVPAALALENHPADSRVKISDDGNVQTLTSRCGTGGGNVPLLLDVPVTLKVRCGGGSGGKGALIQTDKSATIACNNDQTVFVPFVKGTRPHSADEGQEWKQSETANTVNTFDVGESRCNELVVKAFGVCSKHSNSMKSDNPHSGFYEAETSRTIDTSNQSPCKNQGGMVVLEGNGSRPSHHGDGYKEADTMYTLNTTEQHGIAYGIDRAAYNQGKNALYDFAVEEEIEPTIVAKGPGAVAQPASFYPQMKAESQCYRDDGISNTLVNGTNPGYQNAVVYSTSKASYHTFAEAELANTLVASDYKDPPVVNDRTAEIEYIVRRLTPQECALLQAMPSWWCDGLETENPTDAEINLWTEIFETHRKAIGSASKPKSRNQIIKWLKNPYSDSAAYKMWGNAICMSCGLFVLAAIAANHEQ